MNPWESDPVVSAPAAPAGGTSPWEHDPVVGESLPSAPAKMTAEQFLNTKHESGVMSPEERQQANLQLQHPIAPQAQPPQQMGAIRNALTQAFHDVLDPFGKAGLRAAHTYGMLPDQSGSIAGIPYRGYNEAMQQGQLFYPEEGRTSATVGHGLGMVALIPGGPAGFAIQAAENAKERQEQRMAGGEEISPLRQALDVAGQAAIAYGFGKLAPGQKISQALLSKLPANIATRLVGAGLVAGVENTAQQVGQNVVAAKVGGEKDRAATEGAGEAFTTGSLFGTVGQGLHEAPGLLGKMRAKAQEKTNAVETQNRPAPVSSEEGVHPPLEGTRPPVGGVREEPAGGRAEGVAGSEANRASSEETPVVSNPGETLGERRGYEAFERGTTSRIASGELKPEADMTLGEKRALDAMERAGQKKDYSQPLRMAQTEEAPQHPARLESADELTDWYKQNNPDDKTGDLIKSMAPHVPYVEAKVPMDQVKPLTGGEDIDRNKVEAMKGMTAEERHNLGPAILGPDGEVFDGNHRAIAAQESGDTHLRAYVPEGMVGKNGIEAAAGGHTEESLLARNKEVEALKSANDPKADHASAQLQADLNSFGTTHGEDAMENVIEKMKEKRPFRPTARKGAIALPSQADVTGPGSIYHEEVKPRVSKLAESAKWSFDKLKDTFPMETGAGSKLASQIAREEFNKANNDQLAVQDHFEDARRGFDKMKPEEQLDFMRNMRDNQPQRSPELQKIADGMYSDANDGRKQLAALGNEAAKAWNEQHYSMLWKKDKAAADSLSTKINRPGKIEGTAGFLKKKTLEDFDDGLAQGLVPKYSNPVEMFVATRAERMKFLAGYKTMDRLASSDSIRRIEPEQQVPEGWAEVPNGTKSVLKDILPGEGRTIAPEEVNRILKNIVTPSAIGNNPIYHVLRDTNNTLTQSMLGLSGFHLRKVTQELINMQAARALDLAGQGRMAEAGQLLKPGGLAKLPFTAIKSGADIQRMMLNTKMAESPEQQRVIDTMKTTFAAKADPAYETQFRQKFQKALDQGGMQGMLRAGAYAPLAANEKLMQDGVFSYVQHAKLHMGSEMIGDFLKQKPNASPTELNQEAAKISDHIDNVLGLMNRDNLFWNRTARDLATLSTLSVGWNYGSGRALGGGLVDLGKGIGGLIKGRGLSDLEGRRVSYLATTTALTALAGAVTTYISTGKGPQRLRDYIFPPNGAKDREGHDIRINTGFYTTDYYDFIHDPINTLKAKGSPLLHAASDIATNKDFKGGQVRDTDEPWYKQAGDITKYLIKSGMPLSINQYQQLKEEGTQGTGTKLAGLMGFKTAPKALSESDAEITAHHLLQERGSSAGKTPEEQAKGATMRKLTNELRDKNPDAVKDMQAAVKAQQISPRDIPTLQKRAKGPTGLKGLLGNTELRPDDLMKIWDKMTPDEKRENQWTIRARIGRSAMLPTDKQTAFQKIADGVKK